MGLPISHRVHDSLGPLNQFKRAQHKGAHYHEFSRYMNQNSNFVCVCVCVRGYILADIIYSFLLLSIFNSWFKKNITLIYLFMLKKHSYIGSWTEASRKIAPKRKKKKKIDIQTKIWKNWIATEPSKTNIYDFLILRNRNFWFIDGFLSCVIVILYSVAAS